MEREGELEEKGEGKGLGGGKYEAGLAIHHPAAYNIDKTYLVILVSIQCSSPHLWCHKANKVCVYQCVQTGSSSDKAAQAKLPSCDA